jgi:PAS domain S-box-containing protein
VNPTFSKITGYQAAEVIGKNPRILSSGLQDAHFYDAMWKKVNNTGMWEGEIWDRRKNGEVYPAHTTITAVKDNNGIVTNYIGTFSDITERKRIEQELLQTTKQMRELVANYEASQEAERKSIAREVHDELGQVLSTLRLDISMIRTRFGKKNPELMALIQNTTGLVDRAIYGVRNVSENLRPAVLGMGVVTAIEWLCDNFTAHTGIPCVLDAPEQGVELEEARAVVIFRIVQESLTNVMRHADAHNVDIVISLCGGNLCVAVRDDGRGFNMSDSKQQASFGLLGMRERARAWGGHLDIASAPGKGTVISVHIPFSAKADK